MNVALYTNIEAILPFIQGAFSVPPESMQDNDPIHTCTSKHARSWMESNQISWWKMPLESLDDREPLYGMN